MKDEIIDYIEDLPIQKPFEVTFSMSFKVSGINEADAIYEAVEKFEKKVLNLIEVDETWFDSFHVDTKELNV